MILYYTLTTIYVLVCLMLLLVILLQQGKGGDMASAFGGGSSQTAFGARGGATLMTKLTTIFAVLFMVLALALAIMGQRGSGEESATLDALGGGMPNEDSDGSTATPFFQDLFQNNYSKLQTMGDTLHELLSMQQDASDHH